MVTPTRLCVPAGDAAIRAAAADAARGNCDAGYRGRAVRQHRHRAATCRQQRQNLRGLQILPAVMTTPSPAAPLDEHRQQVQMAVYAAEMTCVQRISQTCRLYLQPCVPASQLPVPQCQHARMLPSHNSQPPRAFCRGGQHLRS